MMGNLGLIAPVMQTPAPLLILVAVCLYGVIAGANIVAKEDARHGWHNLGR